MICYAAVAGTNLCFYAIDADANSLGYLVPLSNQLDIKNRQDCVSIRDGHSVLRSCSVFDRSLGNFRKSSKATLPIFCDALELL